MAIKFFDDEPSGNGSLPWAKEYLEENPKENKKSFPVEEISRVQSDKGYMVRTDKFMCFLFKNQKTTKQLLEALKYYCDSQDGYQVVCVLDKASKNSVRIGVDFDVPTSWFTSGNDRYSTQELDWGVDTNGRENPFLPPVPSKPPLSVPSTHAAATNGRGGRRGLEASAPSAS